jgi:SAM-dependent methyltransferase
MNQAHMEFCASSDWRQIVEESIMPDALRHADLGTDVIEIGPGPGFTTDVLRTLADRLTAVEIDPVLADSLKQRLAEMDVNVVIGDATALAIPDDCFSGAASFHMLHHIPTVAGQDRAFGELARVLKKDGLLVAADGVFSDASLAFHEGDTYNPIDPGDLNERLEGLGFRSVDVHLHDFGWFCTAVASE